MQDEVDKLKGITPKDEELENAKPLLDVSTHISNNYTDDDNLKIEIHKQINTIDSYEKLEEVKTNLTDMYGKLDESVIIYMYEEWFENLASKLGVKKVKQTKTFVDLELSEDISKKINGEDLFMISYEVSRKFKLSYRENKIHIILEIVNLDKHFLLYLIELLTRVLDKIEF